MTWFTKPPATASEDALLYLMKRVESKEEELKKLRSDTDYWRDAYIRIVGRYEKNPLDLLPPRPPL